MVKQDFFLNLIRKSLSLGNRKFIKFALASISPEQFEESINRKLKQTDNDPCSMIELVKQNIESRLIHLNNDQIIELWEMAKTEGVISAIKKLYHCKL